MISDNRNVLRNGERCLFFQVHVVLADKDHAFCNAREPATAIQYAPLCECAAIVCLDIFAKSERIASDARNARGNCNALKVFITTKKRMMTYVCNAFGNFESLLRLQVHVILAGKNHAFCADREIATTIQGAPLRKRAAIFCDLKVLALVECALSDARDALGDIYALKTFTTLERIGSDARNALGDCKRCLLL